TLSCSWHGCGAANLREGTLRHNWLYFRVTLRYKRSTFSLAQGVFLKKVRLDLMEGLCVKQRILILVPSSSHPYSATRCSRMSANFTPCRGVFGCGLLES